METGIIGRALKEGAFGLETYNIRDYADNTRAQVDDYPYGGGAGQVIQAEPVFRAYKDAVKEDAVKEDTVKRRVIYLSPQGRRFNQRMAKEFSKGDELVFLCGHYEGVDERVLEEIVTDYVSAGDYILTGGELPALTVIDAVARLLPGVLGNDESPEIETFYRDLLEYPQYSRPEIWHDKKVPAVLLSGNHKEIEAWRLERSIERTIAARPDLYDKYLARTALAERMKGARVQNIPASEALLFNDTDVLFEGNDLYLIFDHDAGVFYIGVYKKKTEHICPEEADCVRRLIIDFRSKTDKCYVLNVSGLFEDLITDELAMIVFTEKNPLSTTRVRGYGEFGENLRNKIVEAFGQGRTYYGFLDPSQTRKIDDAVLMGLYASMVYVIDFS